jgi:hypothetical protein
MDKIAILVPIRGRLSLLKKMVKSWEDTTQGNSVIIFGIDDDDRTYDEFIKEYGHDDRFIFEIGERTTSLKWLNRLAIMYCEKFEYLAFFEDDCTFVKSGWENKIIDTLSKEKICITYFELGDGLTHLVGLPFLNSEFVRTMGWLHPDCLMFQFCDNFWSDFGNACGIVKKLDGEYMKHNHYSRGENEFDNIAQHIRSTYTQDEANYKNYKKTHFKNDLRKMVNRLVELGVM